jgi:two-component system chemotaxis response regulator CheB
LEGLDHRVKTKVLIVDDSRIFRSAVAQSLSGVDDIHVIGSVWNGIKAMEFIRSNTPPDLVTLDVEMPNMDGLETLKAIQAFNESRSANRPIGVIMLSSFTEKGADITIKALEMGAFDFITKPTGKDVGESIAILRRQLIVKIRYFTTRRISLTLTKPFAPLPPLPAAERSLSVHTRIKAILIGVSTGGPRALTTMLPPLCDQVNVPILVVQHMPPTFTQSLAKSLDARCRHTVREGRNQEPVLSRHVYIAPGGNHMLLREENNTIVTIINRQPPEKGHRPSVNILFRSAATVFGKDVIAVILTGMGVDGTKGAGVLKRAGAYIIAQDKETSVVWGMPGSVQASGHANEILPLEKIPETISTLISNSKEA